LYSVTRSSPLEPTHACFPYTTLFRSDSLVVQWLKKVRVETPARWAIASTVTPLRLCSWTSSRAARCMAMRDWCFFRSRSPRVWEFGVVSSVTPVLYVRQLSESALSDILHTVQALDSLVRPMRAVVPRPPDVIPRPHPTTLPHP